MVITLEDLQNASDVSAFVFSSVQSFLGSRQYNDMNEALSYYLGENPSLYKRWSRIRADTGSIIGDKPQQNIFSNIFGRITKQAVSGVLYYDTGFDDNNASEQLGNSFQKTLRTMAKDAFVSGVSWGFWQYDGLLNIPALSFVPIIHDRTGELAAGIYFWQLDENRPRHYQLFEVDGVTTWVRNGKNDKSLKMIESKTPYRFEERTWRTGKGIITRRTSIGGYERLPIVPMYANVERRSELTKPIKTKINAIDLMNTLYVSETLANRFIYWLISGYGGNISELQAIKRTAQALGIIADHSGKSDGQASISTMKTEMPYEAHIKIVKHLEQQIWRDAMIFDPDNVSGANVATQVRAAQDPEDVKLKSFEHEIEEFIRNIMMFANVESKAVTFIRHKVDDDESIAREIQMYNNMGIPIEVLIKFVPRFRDRQQEILDALSKQDLGYPLNE